MTKIKSSESSQFIVKSNALVEARYRLSLQESYVILWLLTQIRPNDEDFKPHKLKIAEFAKMVQVNVGNRYSELRKITKHLMQRIMEIYSHEEDKTVQVAWLSSAEYQHKQGYVSLEFSPKLKPYLLQLKDCFTKIDLVDTLKLKSIYAIRIFELLLQYLSIGNRKISVDDLRSYCGIEDKEYALYADLKRYVINRAKEEINVKTEYDISYKEIKDSRKIVALEWTIQKKTHFEKSQAEKARIISKELRSKNALIERLVEYGFTKPMAQGLFQKSTEEDIGNSLKAVDLQVSRGNVKNPKAMLRKAIQEKWNPEKYMDKQLKKAG